jgi:hypothetical protein
MLRAAGSIPAASNQNNPPLSSALPLRIIGAAALLMNGRYLHGELAALPLGPLIRGVHRFSVRTVGSAPPAC